MEIKIIQVTSNEIMQILGSLNINAIEDFLDEISILRKNVPSERVSQGHIIV